MQTLKDLTLDKLINLYEGVVVHDRKQLMEWDRHRGDTPLRDQAADFGSGQDDFGCAEMRPGKRFYRRMKKDTLYRHGKGCLFV